MISILRPALQTTVQDLGRHGFRHLGVGQAGAMDQLSLTIGNYLVGNAADAAGLELCMPPASLRLEAPCAIALTGADCSALLDQRPVELGRRIMVQAGQTLELSTPRSGIRAYLCLSGGIDVPPVMGSRSTDLQAGIGGLAGRLLRRGDVLQLSPATPDTPAAQIAHVARTTPTTPTDRSSTAVLLPQMGNLIRVLTGPEFEVFSAAARDELFAAPWKVTMHSNRMGYRLEGPALATTQSVEMNSHAVFPGLIQVPGSGAPIVLMSDAQATGGYPRIGAVIAADQWRLAQIAPGMSIRFERCTRAAALAAWQKQQDYLRRMHWSLGAH